MKKSNKKGKKLKLPRIPVAVNQHAGIHKDKKKAANKYACRKKQA